MAKCIAFPLNARVASLASYARELTEAQTEAMMEQQSLFGDLLGFLEKNAKECLKEATLPQVEFRMDPADLKDLLLNADAWLGNYQRNFTFTAAEEECEYRLILNLHSQESGEEEKSKYFMNATLFSATEGKVQIFDYQTKQWETDKDLQKYWDYMEEDGAEAHYLKGLADFFETGIYFQNYREAIASLRDHRPLIRLYKMMDGLARFEFVANGAGDLLALLVPADPLRPGSAVQCVGEQFVWCQYFSGKRKESTGTPFWLMSLDDLEEEEETSPLPGALLGVHAEKTAKNMSEYLHLWWDHYTPETIYTIPLSARAVVQSETPWEDLFVETLPPDRELTADEQGSLNRLRRYFDQN